MTALEKLKKYKSFPSTLIINGLNYLGIQIAHTLLEQKGLVIILDRYTKENKPLIDKLSNFESFVFVNINGNEDLISKIKTLNYLIYLENGKIESSENISPKDFLKEIDCINKFLEFAVKQSAKTVVTTSLKVHQLSLSNYAQTEYDPKTSLYSNIEQQRYIEKLCFSLHKKYKLNVRILRLGEIYGPNFELSNDSILKSLLEQSMKSKYLKIRGDGLEENYIIHINDATYGLVKALFSPNTDGEVFNLANYENNSTLSIAYALLETDAKAKEIKFLADSHKIIPKPLDPTPNLSKIGWKPRIELGRGLAEIINLLQNGNKTDTPKKEKVEEKSKKNIFKKLYEFFFITEEQFQIQYNTKKSTILEKLKKNTVEKKRVKTSKELSNGIKSTKKSKHLHINKKTQRNFKINWKRYSIITIVLLLIYTLFLSPFIGYFSSLAFAGTNAYSAVNALKTNNYDKLNKSLGNLENNIAKTQNALNGISWFYKITGKEKQRENIDVLLAGIRHLAKGGQQSIGIIQPMANYIQEFSLNFDDETDYTKYLEEIKNNTHEFDVAYIELIKAKELLSTVDYSFLFLDETKTENFKNLQNDLFEKVSKYKDFISVLPETLGYPEEKSYLIILQNDFELRSTGGFIGSYAVVNISNGKIKNITVDDIYNPDGQLTEYIEPPEELKRLLTDTGSWAMRDANWDPDFPTAAKQIEWFYNLETGKSVDGVIAINTQIIQELINIFNEVIIEDGTIVNKENFFTEAEAHHIDFEPGSTEKKDFLGSLAKALIEELEQSNHEKIIEVGALIGEMLNNREIFIYFNNLEAQSVITERFWDGSVTQYNGEYLFIVENNLSGNKVNKYVERKVTEKINIEENKIFNNLTVNYTNNSESNEWPEGSYVNFVQIIIPKNAEVESIIGLENNTIKEQYGYKVISGWTEIGIQEMKSYTIIYKTIPSIDENSGELDYRYLIQKQSGIGDSYINIDITYPNIWILENQESNISQKMNENQITYYGLQNGDIEINLKLKTK